MSTTSTAEIRHRVHQMWSAVAPQWAEYAEEVDRRGEDIAAVMLSRAALRPGERVLELACGPGGVGMAAAAQVAPTGEVVVSDVAAEMVAIAEARARQRGLSNVRTAVRDLEQIDEPDASYDVVLCREGLMFAVEPARALAEIHRVLRDGGRFAAAVWGPRARNPWLGVVFDAITEVTGFPVPPPGVPGPFALDDAAQLKCLIENASFADVTIEEHTVTLLSPSFETWWARTSAVAGPIAGVVARLDPVTRETLLQRLRSAVEPFSSPAGLALPGVTLIASCRR